MKSIEEQIAEIIEKMYLADHACDEIAEVILSEVTIEVECPECNGWRFKIIEAGIPNKTIPCDACKKEGKITKTLKEVIEGMK